MPSLGISQNIIFMLMIRGFQRAARSAGRSPPSQGGGRGFKSRAVHHSHWLYRLILFFNKHPGRICGRCLAKFRHSSWDGRTLNTNLMIKKVMWGYCPVPPHLMRVMYSANASTILHRFSWSTGVIIQSEPFCGSPSIFVLKLFNRDFSAPL